MWSLHVSVLFTEYEDGNVIGNVTWFHLGPSCSIHTTFQSKQFGCSLGLVRETDCYWRGKSCVIDIAVDFEIERKS